ncbi:type II secretion system F family protein [Cohnella faecalis]|uniref:Type II secretion protein F n=1 Tax=Cohnella faecalis TaxID=2315694 RepID=A0A398CMT7_9BACL|nr:type II secretion system F family protein [Cohnella faecalis]RIE00901.1 type II secretion protein F [Cohnella faecalis]
MLITMASAITITVYVVLLILALMARKERETAFHALTEPIGQLLLRTGWFVRLQPILRRQESALLLLREGKADRDALFRWTAESVGQGYAALMAFLLIGSLSGNAALAWIGLIVGAGLPLLRAKELQKRVESRRRRILIELPELLNRLLLLVGAGENVMKALIRSSERGSGAVAHPLYDQLNAALAAMNRGESMTVAMEEFGRRCAVPEAKLFATVLLMNARRGGETLAPALRELTRALWEKRKVVALTMGEQASSRLAFPLAVVFLVIMALAGAPALLLM